MRLPGTEIMDVCQYRPVTKVDLMRHKRDGWIRRIDVASAIFKCILQDRLKYIQGLAQSLFPVGRLVARLLPECCIATAVIFSMRERITENTRVQFPVGVRPIR